MPDFLNDNRTHTELRKTILRLSKYMQKNDSKQLFRMEEALIREALANPSHPLYALLTLLHDDIDLKISQSMFQNTILKSIELEDRETLKLRYMSREEILHPNAQWGKDPAILHFDYFEGFDFTAVSMANPKTFFVMAIQPDDLDLDFLLDTIVCPNIAFSVRTDDCGSEEVKEALAKLFRIDLLAGIEIILPNETKTADHLHALSQCGCLFILQSDSAKKETPLDERTVSIAEHDPILIIDRS